MGQGKPLLLLPKLPNSELEQLSFLCPRFGRYLRATDAITDFATWIRERLVIWQEEITRNTTFTFRFKAEEMEPLLVTQNRMTLSEKGNFLLQENKTLIPR